MAFNTPAFYYTMLALFLVFLGVSLGMTWLRRHHPFVRERDMLLSWLGIAFAAVMYIAVCVDMAHPTTTPCDLIFWSASMFIPFWALPYVCGGYSLWYRFRFNELTLLSLSSKTQVFHAIFGRRWLNSLTFKLVLTYSLCFAMFLVNIIVYLIEKKNGTLDFIPGDSCLGTYGRYVITMEAVVACLLVVIIVILLWNVQDAFFLKDEMRASMISSGTMLIVWAILYFVTPDHSFESDHAIMILVILFLLIVVWFPVGMSLHPNYRHLTGTIRRISLSDSEVGESPKVSEEIDRAEDVVETIAKDKIDFPSLDAKFFRLALVHDQLSASFQKFAVRSFCVENYMFYQHVREYRLRSDLDLAEEANRIFQQFISEQSMFQVNIVFSTYNAIRTEMERKNFDKNLFLVAEKEIFSLMYTDTFDIWKFSSHFKESMAKANYPTKTDLIANAKAKATELGVDIATYLSGDGNAGAYRTAHKSDAAASGGAGDGSPKKKAVHHLFSFSSAGSDKNLKKQGSDKSLGSDKKKYSNIPSSPTDPSHDDDDDQAPPTALEMDAYSGSGSAVGAGSE